MLNATIIKRIEVTKDLIILHIKPDAGVPEFHSGQYVALALPEESTNGDISEAEAPKKGPKLIKRAYSIGSTPHEKGHLEFYLAIVPEGQLTPKIAKLGEGGRIYVAPKITGTFTLKDVPGDRDLVLISTGTGIAPFMSMLRTPTTWTLGRKITIIHGVRYPEDLAYRNELEQYFSDGKPIAYIPLASRADDSWRGERGRVQRLFTDKIVALDPNKQSIFLCGNPAMIEEMENYLISNGFIEHTKKAPGNLHLEKYW